MAATTEQRPKGHLQEDRLFIGTNDLTATATVSGLSERAPMEVIARPSH